MSHVKHVNELCHTQEWVTLHILMSHVTHMCANWAANSVFTVCACDTYIYIKKIFIRAHSYVHYKYGVCVRHVYIHKNASALVFSTWIQGLNPVFMGAFLCGFLGTVFWRNLYEFTRRDLKIWIFLIPVKRILLLVRIFGKCALACVHMHIDQNTHTHTRKLALATRVSSTYFLYVWLNMWACVYVHMCMCVYVYMCICVYVHMCKYLYMCIDVYVYMCIRAYV